MGDLIYDPEVDDWVPNDPHLPPYAETAEMEEVLVQPDEEPIVGPYQEVKYFELYMRTKKGISSNF